ncbi:unnamed protein product, partial [Psylliodes chrysocephalus]
YSESNELLNIIFVILPRSNTLLNLLIRLLINECQKYKYKIKWIFSFSETF